MYLKLESVEDLHHESAVHVAPLPAAQAQLRVEHVVLKDHAQSASAKPRSCTVHIQKIMHSLRLKDHA